MKTVASLPLGAFHLAVIIVGMTSVPILDGEIIKNGVAKELTDLANSAIYDEQTVVLLFQKTEVSEIITK